MKNANKNRARRGGGLGAAISSIIGLVILVFIGYYFYTSYVEVYGFGDGVIQAFGDAFDFIRKIVGTTTEGVNQNNG